MERQRPRWLQQELRHGILAFGGGVLLAAVAMFASGGILYLTFQDIAPQAQLERHWGPPLGAVVGFAFGLTGHMLLEH